MWRHMPGEFGALGLVKGYVIAKITLADTARNILWAMTTLGH